MVAQPEEGSCSRAVLLCCSLGRELPCLFGNSGRWTIPDCLCQKDGLSLVRTVNSNYKNRHVYLCYILILTRQKHEDDIHN